MKAEALTETKLPAPKIVDSDMTLESEIPIVPNRAPAKLRPVFLGKWDEKCSDRCFSELSAETLQCEEITSDNTWEYKLKIFCYPEEDPSCLQSKIKTFLLSLANFMTDYWGKTAFVQFWEPITTKDGRRVLSVSKQPFAVRQYLKGLCRYRYYSEELCRIGNRMEVGNNFGPVGRAFTRGSIEFSPHVDIYSHKDFPFKNHAKQCGVGGYLALPIFELKNSYIQGQQPSCVGVLEFISSEENVLSSFDTGICMKKLKDVGLAFRYPSHFEAQIRPYFNFPPSKGKLEEMSSVLGIVRRAFNLPLIQVWLPCICYGSDVYVTCEPNDDSISKNTHLVCGIQCTNRDEKGSFPLFSYAACDSEVYFVGIAESWVGRALLQNKIHCIKDTRQYSIMNYPLVNLCHSADLVACFAVPLQLVDPKLPPLVLELFLPTQLKLDGDRSAIINPILTMVAQELSKYYVNFGLRQDYVPHQDHPPNDATGIKEFQVPTEENNRADTAPCRKPSGNGCHSDDSSKTPSKEKPWLTYVRNKHELVPCWLQAVEEDYAENLQHQPNDAIGIKERKVSTEEIMGPYTVQSHEPLVAVGQSTIKCKRRRPHKKTSELPNNYDDVDLQSDKRYRPSDNSNENQDEDVTISIPILAEPLAGQYTIECKSPVQQTPELPNNSDDAEQQSEKRCNPSNNSKEKQDEAGTDSIPILAEHLGNGQSTIKRKRGRPPTRPYDVPPLVGQSTIKRKAGRPRKLISVRTVRQTPELPNNSDDAEQQSEKRYSPSNNSKEKQDEAGTVSIPILAEPLGQSTIKRKRGRPRKIISVHTVQQTPELPNNSDDAEQQSEKRYSPSNNSKEKQDEADTVSMPILAEPLGQSTIKRKRGRPRTRPYDVPPLVGQSTIKRKRGRPHKIISVHPVQQTPELPNNPDADPLYEKKYNRLESIGDGVVYHDHPIPCTSGKGKNTKPENEKVDHGTSIPGKGRTYVPETNEVHNCSTTVKAATVSIPIPIEIPVAKDGSEASTGPGDNVADHGPSIPSIDPENDKVDHGTSIPTNEKGRYTIPGNNEIDHNYNTILQPAMVSTPTPVEIPVATDRKVTSIGLSINVVDPGLSIPSTTGEDKNMKPENDKVDHGTSICTNGKGRSDVPENDEVDHNCSLIVIASYQDDLVKFPFSSSSGIEGLRGALIRRFELEVGRFKIKYPEDGGWFLLSCSEDLSLHMRTLAAAGQTFLKLSIFSTT